MAGAVVIAIGTLLFQIASKAGTSHASIAVWLEASCPLLRRKTLHRTCRSEVKKGGAEMDLKWRPIDTLPPPGERPGRVFVVVRGSQFHSGVSWLRQRAGIARTQNDGFCPEDIDHIAMQDHMDPGTARVTHWMPWCLPNLPEAD